MTIVTNLKIILWNTLTSKCFLESFDVLVIREQIVIGVDQEEIGHVDVLHMDLRRRQTVVAFQVQFVHHVVNHLKFVELHALAKVDWWGM